MRENKLYVQNMEQKVLFYCELEGQISDGWWENARPFDHHRDWMLGWNDIMVSDDRFGRSFYALKDNYNFSNPELIDLVGERMLNVVHFAQMYKDKAFKVFEFDHWLLPDSKQECINFMTYPEDWVKAKWAKLESFGLSKDDILKVYTESSSYGLRELRMDLNALKRAVRTAEWQKTPISDHM